MSRTRISLMLAVAVACGAQPVLAQSYDPPGRIGRVSYLSGSVSLLPVGETDWTSASLNYPVTTGDALWADTDARAELHVGASSVHLAPGTSLALDAVEDDLIQLRLGQGGLEVRLRELDGNDTYEIDTPSGSIVLRAIGLYRIDVTPDGRRTTLTVRDGDADVMDGDEAYPVRPGTSVTLTGASARPLAMDRAVPPDAWENWAESRDRREDVSSSARYVTRDMVGYEDLDTYGDWQTDAEYGPVWYPRAVPASWVPYRTGRWVSVRPWGWTWVDDEPWGFAPFHYGRWANRRGRWCWVPGQVRARPVYAPALVAFVSGDDWGVSMSFGGGGGVGWIPLGPREVFVPSYHHSTTYIRNVNITNVNVAQIDFAHVDAGRERYVNRDVPGAVTAVPREAFLGSRPVAGAARPVRPNDLERARTASAPVAGGAAVLPPPRGVAPDRGNAGAVHRPPVELPRTDRLPGAGAGTAARGAPPARGRDNKPPPVAPHTSTPPGRGRDVTRPPTAPPQSGRGGRGGNPPTAVTPPVQPTPPARARGRSTEPPRSVPPPVQSTPPARAGGRSTEPPRPVPPPAQSAPPDRGRGRVSQLPRPVPPPAVPTSPRTVPPPPPPTQGRGTPPPPPSGRGRTSPPDQGRGGKPVKPKPDSGRGRGGGEVQLE